MIGPSDQQIMEEGENELEKEKGQTQKKKGRKEKTRGAGKKYTAYRGSHASDPSKKVGSILWLSCN